MKRIPVQAGLKRQTYKTDHIFKKASINPFDKGQKRMHSFTLRLKRAHSLWFHMISLVMLKGKCSKKVVPTSPYSSDCTVMGTPRYHNMLLLYYWCTFAPCANSTLVIFPFCSEKPLSLISSPCSLHSSRFMPPDDPLGRHGPTLDNFLRKTPRAHKKLPCPYGKLIPFRIMSTSYANVPTQPHLPTCTCKSTLNASWSVSTCFMGL